MIENINIDVVPQQVDVEVLENTDIELTVNKREFNIVGDNVYIAQVSNTPPQWLADIVNSAVQLSINNTMTELRGLKDSILDELNVVKNQYTMAINQIATSEASFVSAVEALNATYQDTQATIANIQTTYATKDQASATALGIVQSELENGAIAAEILTLKNTFVTPLNATSSSLEYLESTIGDPDTGVGATATAMELMQTYVGTDSAGAYQNTGLSAYLCDSTGLVGGGNSGVANGLYTEIVGGVPVTKSKWEYNSQIMKPDGTMVNSGFGLKSGDFSEFWINADKFKMTNNTGDTPNETPVFSIDTTDGNKVQFNGKVTFSSDHIVGIPTHTSGTGEPTGTAVAGSTYTNTSTIPATIYVYNGGWKVTGTPGALTASDLSSIGTTVIDGSRITTGTVDAARINAASILAQVITLDSSGPEAKITNSAGTMTIDFKNGSIYIA